MNWLSQLDGFQKQGLYMVASFAIVIPLVISTVGKRDYSPEDKRKGVIYLALIGCIGILTGAALIVFHHWPETHWGHRRIVR